MFRDRRDAGRKLGRQLAHLAAERPVVLALPRGGVLVGFEVAAALKAPLDIVLVRKIGAPWQPELALAAVVDGDSPQVVRNERLIQIAEVTEDFIREETARQLAEIERRRATYLAGRQPVDIAGRVAIVVDDGIATGATARAALTAVRRRRPSHLVLAVPVAAPDALARLHGDVDEAICLLSPDSMWAIGQFYADFHQVGDDEVRALLTAHPPEDDLRPSPGR